MKTLILSLIALSACTTNKDVNPGPVDTSTGPADTDTDTDTDSDTGEVDTSPQQVVRFVAMGDGGEGNDNQYQVSQAVEQVCGQVGCDFVLYMGDNFYNEGVDGVDDAQFQSKFELPYQNLSLPFYVVLGNHDYGLTSTEFWRTDAQVDYTQNSSKWKMPAKHYAFTEEHAVFFGLDTNSIMWGLASDQESWLNSAVSASGPTWRIAFGHHPYLSNGQHGNAGQYEGIPGIPVVSGGDVEDFMEDYICGKVDVYLSGHDHNRQWLEPNCGTEFIVSGAAAKSSDLKGRGSATFWEDDTTQGFLWVELADKQMTGVFYDKNGTENYRRVISK